MVYYIVGSLLLFTTITDIFWRLIPKILILIYIGAGIFILHLYFLIIYIISMFIGAGDIKLFSLIIGFLGIYDGINMSVISLVLAGVGSLVYLIFSAQFITRFNILLNYCTRVLASGQVEKYSEYKLRDKHMIPVAPCFLAGFILWRCFC